MNLRGYKNVYKNWYKNFFGGLLALAMMAGAITAMTATTANAGGLGYVDDRRLIDQSPQGQDIIKKLEAEFAERSRELKGRFDRFKARQQDLEKTAWR